MKNERIIILVIAFFLGMLVLYMVKNGCECNIEEGFSVLREDGTVVTPVEPAAKACGIAISKFDRTASPAKDICDMKGEQLICTGGEATEGGNWEKMNNKLKKKCKNKYPTFDDWMVGIGGGCAPAYSWHTASYDVDCPTICGSPASKQTRKVTCTNEGGTVVEDADCTDAGDKPPTTNTCAAIAPCDIYGWHAASYAVDCPTKCGSPASVQTRDVSCMTGTTPAGGHFCASLSSKKPNASRTCPARDPCVDACDPNPCDNEGTCKPDGQDNGTFLCECKDGWTGTTCGTCPPGWSRPNCEHNPCFGNPCKNKGICTVGPGSEGGYTCSCAEGYSGPTCDVNSCDPNPCQNDGICTLVGTDNYSCACNDKHSGDNCETLTGPCDQPNAPDCGDYGDCDPSGDSECICNIGFVQLGTGPGSNCGACVDGHGTFPKCTPHLDLCFGVDCGGGGICRSGTCRCIKEGWHVDVDGVCVEQTKSVVVKDSPEKGDGKEDPPVVVQEKEDGSAEKGAAVVVTTAATCRTGYYSSNGLEPCTPWSKTCPVGSGHGQGTSISNTCTPCTGTQWNNAEDDSQCADWTTTTQAVCQNDTTGTNNQNADGSNYTWSKGSSTTDSTCAPCPTGTSVNVDGSTCNTDVTDDSDHWWETSSYCPVMQDQKVKKCFFKCPALTAADTESYSVWEKMVMLDRDGNPLSISECTPSSVRKKTDIVNELTAAEMEGCLDNLEVKWSADCKGVSEQAVVDGCAAAIADNNLSPVADKDPCPLAMTGYKWANNTTWDGSGNWWDTGACCYDASEKGDGDDEGAQAGGTPPSTKDDDSNDNLKCGGLGWTDRADMWAYGPGVDQVLSDDTVNAQSSVGCGFWGGGGGESEWWKYSCASAGNIGGHYIVERDWTARKEGTAPPITDTGLQRWCCDMENTQKLQSCKISDKNILADPDTPVSDLENYLQVTLDKKADYPHFAAPNYKHHFAIDVADALEINELAVVVTAMDTNTISFDIYADDRKNANALATKLLFQLTNAVPQSLDEGAIYQGSVTSDSISRNSTAAASITVVTGPVDALSWNARSGGGKVFVFAVGDSSLGWSANSEGN